MKGQDIFGCLCITAVLYGATATAASAQDAFNPASPVAIAGGPITIKSQGNFFVG